MSGPFSPDAEPSQEDKTAALKHESLPNNIVWIIIGAVGTAITLLIGLVQSFSLEARQGRQFVFAAVIVVVTVVVFRMVFRFAWRTLWAHPALLAPIGVAMAAATTVDLLGKAPLIGMLLAPSWAGTLLGVSLSASLMTVLNICVWTAFAAWQTDLLWRTVRDDKLPSLAPWKPICKNFLRTFVALAIGLGVLLIGVVASVALATVSMLLALVLMGALGVIWNLCTTALLPTVIDDARPLRIALGNGFGRSWRLKGQWWTQLLAHLLLLGLLIFLRVNFSKTERTVDPVNQRSHVNWESKTNVSWRVDAFWVGGYENQCRWYTKYAAELETKVVPIITALLGLLFLVVAVGMKLTVIRELVVSGGNLNRRPDP